METPITSEEKRRSAFLTALKDLIAMYRHTELNPIISRSIALSEKYGTERQDPKVVLGGLLLVSVKEYLRTLPPDDLRRDSLDLLKDPDAESLAELEDNIRLVDAAMKGWSGLSTRLLYNVWARLHVDPLAPNQSAVVKGDGVTDDFLYEMNENSPTEAESADEVEVWEKIQSFLPAKYEGLARVKREEELLKELGIDLLDY